LDLIFNFPKAHYVLDEFIMAGEVQEPSMKAILRAVQQADDIEVEEQEERRLF
jgi:AP-1 complex subunit sigma 1/2